MDVINSLLRAARAGNLKKVIEFIDDELVDLNAGNQNGLTALHAASKEGHVRVAEELISRGANVHAKTLKGNTALHIASLAGHEPVVRLLIENGADVDAQSASGFTALYMAAQENHESIVKLLLASRANQNIATTDGFTPLAVAMQQGHEQIASILLNNEAKGRIRFPGTTESGRSLLHIAAKKDDCAAAALLIQNNISPDITSKSGFTALHVACHYGNVNIAKLLIDRQADVNFQAKHNITPLHVAAKWGQIGLVDLLLANNAKIDSTTRDGLTPLHCAARSGHELVVEDLIRNGAPISAKTRSGLAPLHMATQGDHLKSAQILLNNRAPVDDVTVDYLTALHVASHCGHVKVAKLLLNNKADPNFRALNGFTSLHIACKKNRLKVVELLLKYGASLNAVTESGLTPLHVASFMGCVQIVTYLLDNHANIESVTVRGETPLHLATRANQIEVIEVLLRYGANVSARAKESQTALHIASRLGNSDIARLLIEQGIDVDAPTKDSYTALHIAAKEGHEDVVSKLLDNGANISCATRNHGFTPLHLASKYGIDGVVDLLLSYGAPVDAQGKNGVTPLHVATHYDHPSVVQLLLSNRGPRPAASPHAMAKNGYTALHIAAKGNRLYIADALLNNGADPNAESKAGFCPLHLAAQEGRPDMADLLLNSGALVNCRAKNGITPLHLCAQEDHINVAQLLVKRGAHLDAQTRGGFTPLHVASHFARLKMIRFLLANGANVNIPAASGYTPLHQASQQGNPQIVELLLQYNAKPDALTETGQTALSIAQNLGYVSIIDTLKVVTETVVKTTTMTITEEKFRIVAPETMQETFVSDSEDEADDQAHAESVKFLTTDVMKNFNSPNMADEYHTSQSNLDQQQYQQQQQQQQRAPSRQAMDEMSQDLTYLSREAPLDGGESTFGGAASYSQLGESVLNMGSDLHVNSGNHQQFADFRALDGSSRRLDGTESPIQVGFSHNEQALNQLSPDNVDIQRKPPQQAGFLVSFMVDARGGAMRGCRHSGVRVIIPPNSAQMPMRITCRYLRRERLVHPPPLMEGEACASKIMEVGPAGAKFLAPVLIEVPHFASLRGKEREIIILRSDSGEVWREHLVEADEQLIDSIIRSGYSTTTADTAESPQPPPGDLSEQENADPGVTGSEKRRLTRIVTTEFPQYFAIISRIRQEVHAVGPEGSTVSSQVVPRVQAIFTDGALTKRIKIGLQPKVGSKREVNESDQQQQDTGLESSNLQQDQQHDRATSPASAGDQANQARPNSASAKRRSRFLACFGAGQGSIDLLNSDESSAGGDSPRQPCKEKLVERRFIIGDVVDSEGEENERSSPSLSGDSAGETKVRRKRHVEPVELVPEDYYIEKEPPLILNVEPKTYGKRLASSSAQTDNKLNTNGFMSISAKQPKKRGLLRGRRKKNKTQLTIRCDQGAQRNASKSQAADSSLETVENGHETSGAAADIDDISIIHDVITSEDQKWRTCTIQTDSDSVTVNYVTIDPSSEANASAAEATGASAGHDDGYVSGSGDLNRQSSHTFGKGLFSFTSSKQAATEPPPPQKKAKKQEKQQKTTKALVKEASGEEVTTEPEALESSIEITTGEETTLTKDETDEPSQTRSISPNSKELKQRLKLERQEKLKREKKEKRHLKELEDAAAKAEKLKKKQEKEAKKAEKAAQKAAKKASSVSPVPPLQTPEEKEDQREQSGGKQQASVKFASSLVETNSFGSGDQEAQQDSIQRVIETTNSSYEQAKERLSQEDGRDMVHVSISERAGSDLSADQQVDDLSQKAEEKLISFSDSEEPNSRSLGLAPEVAVVRPIAGEATSVEEPIQSVSESQTRLKPILKHQQSSCEETAAEIVIKGTDELKKANEQSGSPLVVEANEEAFKVADTLKAATEASATTIDSPIVSSTSSTSKKDLLKQVKEEKERLKREAKSKLEEEKRLAKEAKKVAKEAEKARKAAEAEAERLAKAAKAEEERLAKEAKAEQERLKKEAKKQLKLAKKVGEQQEALVVPTSTDASTAEASIELKKVDVEPSKVVNEGDVIVVGEMQHTSEPKAVVELLDSEKMESIEGKEDKDNEDKKKAKKGGKRQKKVKASKTKTISDNSESTEPISTASKSSFFSRLFSRSSSSKGFKAPGADASLAAPTTVTVAADTKSGEKPVIMSEMYPSDPDDADGEMILEVNVPKNLIEGKQQQTALDSELVDKTVEALRGEFSQTSDTAASQTMQTSTTIDESFATSEIQPIQSDANQTDPGKQQREKETGELGHDDQATLVNVTSEIDDDDATENVSQANDELVLSSPVKSESEPIQGELRPAEGVAAVTDGRGAPPVLDTIVIEDAKRGAEAKPETGKKKEAKKSKEELREEKLRKELEAKLEKEAKKRAKEEAKLEKKAAKEEKMRAEMRKKMADIEAKKRAKEEKERIKLEAKEAKKMAALAKKNKRESAKPGAAIEATSAAPSEAIQQQQSASGQPSTSAAAADSDETDAIDISNMTPINTETEVQQIVEEKVDDDGILTKTTKTIETKYVTLRQEELRTSEHREMPVEEFERLRRQQSSSSASSHSEEGARGSQTKVMVEEEQVAIKKRSVGQVAPYSHAELDEIRTTPSYFGPDCPVEIPSELSPKKAMRLRIKLNKKLIKRAFRLAQSEAKRAKKHAHAAKSEIAVCDEAAKEARKRLKHALKEAKRASKLTIKEHKKMDKVDKKISKRQKKIDKRSKKLEKRSEELAKKEAKKREKLAKKEAKTLAKQGSLERQGSQKNASTTSAASRKSIRLEDIGDPVLRSSSRLSIGEMVNSTTIDGNTSNNSGNNMEANSSRIVMTGLGPVEERFSPNPSDDLQIEMSLEESLDQHNPQQQQQELQQQGQVQAPDYSVEPTVEHSLTISKRVEHPDGRVEEELSVLTGDEAYAALQAAVPQNQVQSADEDDKADEASEEIDLVSDLPDFSTNKEQRGQQID